MADLVISTHLVQEGEVLMDKSLAVFASELSKGRGTRKALKAASLSAAQLEKWRTRVIRLLSADPIAESGEGFSLSEVGSSLAEEFQTKSSRVHVQLSSGLQVPLLAVDGIVLVEGKLVVVKRKYFPFQGSYCLPGGMVEYGETVEDAVIREVEEETGLRTGVESLVGVYSNPARDPRGHVVSLAFSLEMLGGELSSGSDAAEVALLDLRSLPELGFDHSKIVSDFLRG